MIRWTDRGLYRGAETDARGAECQTEPNIHRLHDGRHGNAEVGGPEAQDCQTV